MLTNLEPSGVPPAGAVAGEPRTTSKATRRSFGAQPPTSRQVLVEVIAGGRTGLDAHCADRRAIQLRRGEMLYHEGDVADGLYLVLRGALKVLVRSDTDKPRLADIVGAGDVIGIATLEQAPHAESIVAAGPSAVLALDGLDALSREQRASVAASLARQFGRSREYADDMGLPTGARISRVLARLADRFCSDREAVDVHLPFSLTHDDLALLAGCARVTATRILGELKEAGAVRGNRGDYSVTPERLEQATDRYVIEYL